MFNSLFGKITGKGVQRIFLETSGIEWDITASEKTVAAFTLGEQRRIFTWLQHTENAMTIFGFQSEVDRELFLNLTKVDGLGPKTAIKIMSSAESEILFRALNSGDLKTLEKIPGFGKKTAAKALLALKGKLAFSDSTEVVAKKSEFDDVILALCEMGFERKKCEEKISAIVKDLEQKTESQDFFKKSRAEKEQIIFRRAIVELAN